MHCEWDRLETRKRKCTDVPRQPGRRMKAPWSKQPHPHGREQAAYYKGCAVLHAAAVAAPVAAAAAAVPHRNVSESSEVQTIEVFFGKSRLAL